MRSPHAPSLLLVCSLACGAPPPSAPPPGTEAPPLLDDLFARIAERVPGFGGVFLDEEGFLTAYLQQDPVPAAAPVTTAAPARLRTALAEVLGERRMATLRVRRGRFSFPELQAARAALEPEALALPGVLLVDLDEARNGLRVAIVDEAKRPLVEAAARRARVPEGALRIEVTPALAPLSGLRDRHRPPLGGVQIAFSRGLCTLGFNARRGGALGFVTNAHCTARRGAHDGSILYQPAADDDQRVGAEELDPGFRTAAPCPSGRRCRYSDSAFIRYDGGEGAAPGQIAEVLSYEDPRAAVRGTLRLVALAAPPLVGERVAKVGRTTGLSAGEVVATCVSINVVGTQQTQLCQTVVLAAVGPGDSGSPVYWETDGGDAELVGLLWGGDGERFVFSPIAQVASELGPLRVCAAGFGC